MQYIIASHGNLAKGYKDTIELLTHFQDIHAICAYREEEFPDNLIKLLESFPKEEMVILFVDILGGSVYQEAVALMKKFSRLHIIAGVNLPLILEILLRESTEEEIAESVNNAKEQMVYVKRI